MSVAQQLLAQSRYGKPAARRRAPTSTPKLSQLERDFAFNWRALGGPPFEAEYTFAKPRRWRFDCAWPAVKVAVELEGGIWTGGRHSRGKGFADDCEKYNAAALLGWAVLRFTERDLRQRPFEVVAQVKALIEKRTPRVLPPQNEADFSPPLI